MSYRSCDDDAALDVVEYDWLRKCSSPYLKVVWHHYVWKRVLHVKYRYLEKLRDAWALWQTCPAVRINCDMWFLSSSFKHIIILGSDRIIRSILAYSARKSQTLVHEVGNSRICKTCILNSELTFDRNYFSWTFVFHIAVCRSNWAQWISKVQYNRFGV